MSDLAILKAIVAKAEAATMFTWHKCRDARDVTPFIWQEYECALYTRDKLRDQLVELRMAKDELGVLLDMPDDAYAQARMQEMQKRLISVRVSPETRLPFSGKGDDRSDITRETLVNKIHELRKMGYRLDVFSNLLSIYGVTKLSDLRGDFVSFYNDLNLL